MKINRSNKPNISKIKTAKKLDLPVNKKSISLTPANGCMGNLNINGPFTWKKVFAGLEELKNNPTKKSVLKDLIVNIRLETGHGIQDYKGTELTKAMDSVDIPLNIRRALKQIVSSKRALDPEIYFFTRQLISSLRLAAETDTIEELRALSATIDENLLPEAVEDLRQGIHSKLCPQTNLRDVEFLIEQIEPGIKEYKKTGSIDKFGYKINFWVKQKPFMKDNLEKALELLKQMRQILIDLDLHDTRPGQIDKRLEEIKKLKENLLEEKFSSVDRKINELTENIEKKQLWEASMKLGTLRYLLYQLALKRTEENRLNTLFLDICLEKVGYVMYGETIQKHFKNIDENNINEAFDLLRSLMFSVIAKGQGNGELISLTRETRKFNNEIDQFFVIDRINRECIKITKKMRSEYYSIVEKECINRGIKSKSAVNAFIDQMIRGTTVQHLADLISNIRSTLLSIIEKKYGKDYLDNLVRMSGQTYAFAQGEASLGFKQKSIIGGKGASLFEMAKLGLPVPPGFILSAENCINCIKSEEIPKAMKDIVLYRLNELEKSKGKKFGDPDNPLIVSVRGGAANSMPGMLETILNVGLNDATVKGLAEQGGEIFAFNSYRRLIEMFAPILGVDSDHLRKIYEIKLNESGGKKKLSIKDLKELIGEYKAKIMELSGKKFPQDPKDQLFMAISAIFDSWISEHAIKYREKHNISHDIGTACIIQTMAFGNLDDKSGTGVISSRHRKTGEKILHGEFLYNGQGDEVRSGYTTPYTVGRLQKDMPDIYNELEVICKKLEHLTGDVRDIEFTLEKGKLYVLQTRKTKDISEKAAKRIKNDMLKEGIKVKKLDTNNSHSSIVARFDSNKKREVVATGFPGSPGVATGKIVFDAKTAVKWSEKGIDVILVRTDTSPSDYEGLVASKGVLTSIGGTTSHAAENARAEDIPCVTGCNDLTIDSQNKKGKINSMDLKEGDEISIDGNSGQILKPIPIITYKINGLNGNS